MSVAVAAGLVLAASIGTPQTAEAGRFFDLSAKKWVTYKSRKSAESPVKRETVKYDGPYEPNTIIVNTSERRLYHVLEDGKALKYGIGVGREGFQWAGSHRISRKAEWPGWTPPPAMRKRQPDLPQYMEGGLNNPLGARALYIGQRYTGFMARTSRGPSDRRFRRGASA